MSDSFTIEIDGRDCAARSGETLVEAAARAGIEIPTMCHDSRLEPMGSCRVCLVEIDGQSRLQPACAWRVEPGMCVTTANERIERHRRVLYGLYLADHRLGDDGLPVETANGNELRRLAAYSIRPVAYSWPRKIDRPCCRTSILRR